MNLDLNSTGPLRKFRFNKLDELGYDMYENAHIFKDKMKAIHDQHIVHCLFNPSDKVLLY